MVLPAAIKAGPTEDDIRGGPGGTLRNFIVGGAVIALSIHGAQARGVERLDDNLLLGVGTHQGIGGAVGERGYVPATSVDEMRELGATAFRDDLPWSDFEAPTGQLGLGARLGRLAAQISSAPARPLLILGAGHPLVPNSEPPTTDAARRRFVAYAEAAARLVAERQPLFELWNEWNLKSKQSSDFNVDTYGALAKDVYPAVKKVSPGALFLIGAVGDDPGWTWTKNLLQQGLLRYADGISIHLYNHCANVSKRTASEIIDRLAAFHRMVGQAADDADFPIYLTEVGWPTAMGKCGVSEQAEADNVAQLILWAATATSWLKGIWEYELKDSGANPRELEDNFGLYHFDNSPKPAACAFRDSWAFIRSSLHADAISLAPGITAVRSEAARGVSVAVWSDDPAKHYELRLKDEAPHASFGYPCGASQPASGRWMAVSGTPLLISAHGSDIPELQIRLAH